MNTENALAEQVRQFNASLAEDKRQFDASYALQQAQFSFQKSQASKKSSSKSSGGSGGSGGSGVVYLNKEPEQQATTVSTYSEAAKALRDAGATKGDGGLMTEGEWKRRKYAGSTSAETSYGSYNEYINSFVNWKKQNPD